MTSNSYLSMFRLLTSWRSANLEIRLGTIDLAGGDSTALLENKAASDTSSSRRVFVPPAAVAMHLMYYTGSDGKRVYTLKVRPHLVPLVVVSCGVDWVV